MSFLLLNNWTEQSVDDTEKGRITVHTTCTVAPAACVHCGCVANLYRWSVKEQELVREKAPVFIDRQPGEHKVFLPQYGNSPETIHQIIYTENGGVCPSCKGWYEPRHMRLYDGQVLVGKVWLLCRQCYDRFNTEPESSERSVSTHYFR